MSAVTLTIWNEFRNEKTKPEVERVYADGIHEAIAEGMRARDGISVRTATLDEPENGLPSDLLDDTDVLAWWGHSAHEEVADETVDRVQARVLAGMGLIVLHSAHMSKPFRRLMGTTCTLHWREAAEKERLWVVDPAHPITAGLGRFVEVPETEMYGEYFDVPAPDELVFVSWFEGGEVFRSGAVWKRGKGKVFYFRPGHETHDIYRNSEILKVLENAVRYVAFAGSGEVECAPVHFPTPLEPFRKH